MLFGVWYKTGICVNLGSRLISFIWVAFSEIWLGFVFDFVLRLLRVAICLFGVFQNLMVLGDFWWLRWDA